MQEAALSDYGRASKSRSPVSRMMAAFADDFRKDVGINLGVGYVSEATIPHQLIHQALGHVVANPQTYHAPFNYGGPAGPDYLVESICRFYVRRNVGGLANDMLQQKRITIGASGATSLLEAIATVSPRGIVLASDPIYYIDCDLLERLGHEIIAVPEDDGGIDTHLLQKTLEQLGDRRSQISFIYLVTVNNPTCSVLSNERREQMVDITADLSDRIGRNIPLVFDTAYELLIHDSNQPPLLSGFHRDQLGVVYEIGTLSKILAPALRIGFMISPDTTLTDAVVQKVSDVGFSAPLISQGIASYLLDHHADAQIESVNAGYRNKAQRVRRAIDRELGPHIEQVRGGSAGFYFYLTFKPLETHERSPSLPLYHTLDWRSADRWTSA